MASRPTVLEGIKIQVRVVIPTVRALQSGLGTKRVRIRSWVRPSPTTMPRGRRAASRREIFTRETSEANAFPVDSVVVDDTPATFGLDMTGCRFAEYFRAIGEPEIGALSTGGVDFANEAGVRPDWQFARTQTLMQGAACCDFRWRRRDQSDDRR